MNHSEIRAFMPDYLEGDLALDSRALFDAHLDECAECMGEIDEMRSTIAALRGLPDPEMPHDLADNVMRRIRMGEGRSSLLDRLGESLAFLFAPRILAPVSAALLAAGLLLGTDSLRDALDDGPGSSPRSVEITPSPIAPSTTPSRLVRAGTRLAPGAHAAGEGRRRELVWAPSAGSEAQLQGAHQTRTAGQELIALSELLAERSPRRSRFDDLPLSHLMRSIDRPVQTVPVAMRPGSGGMADTASVPGMPGLTIAADAEHRWPSAAEWLDHLMSNPSEFADRMATRTLAEQEHWIHSLAGQAIEQGRLDAVVASLRTSGGRTATTLADDFAAVGTRAGDLHPVATRSD